jgi:hypothetical protein
MPFDSTDIRSTLAPPDAGRPSAQAAPADYLRFYDTAPLDLGGVRRWRGRSQNLVIDLLDVDAGAVVDYPGGPDETGVLLTDGDSSVSVLRGDETTPVHGETLTFVPPGPVRLRFETPGRVVVLSTTRAEGLAADALNADAYRTDHPNVAPVVPWPEPVGGYRVRTYDLTVPTLGTPPFRLFRCSSFMVNYIAPRTGPRDTTKMSPHDHADFEQLSLVLQGEYVHHLRWPWTTDLSEWRQDEHERCGAASLTVIPPPALHTSEAVGAGTNHLIDIFSPPRRDFSSKPGWVLNADDYPMPETAE